MKHVKLGLLVYLVFALALTGCAKKISDEAKNAGTGFDSLSTTDELSQLPQAPVTEKQVQPVEPLPVEMSPVTQSVPQAAGQVASAAADAVKTALGGPQEIQKALKAAGLYDGAIDGKIGPKTKKAIEEFQKAHGLKADGKVGPKTWAAMEAVLNGSAPVAAPAVTTDTEETTTTVQ